MLYKSSKIEKVLELLRDDLRQCQPGDKLLSERALSKKFAVSRMTLRRSLEILKRNEELYSENGKGLFKAKNANLEFNGKIAVALESINIYNFEIVETIVKEASKQKINVIVHQNNLDVIEQKKYLSSLRKENHLSGLIVNPPTNEADFKQLLGIYREIRNSGIHVLFLNAPYFSVRFDNVSFDDKLGVEMLVQHLQKLGHRKIAFVTSGNAGIRGKSRLSGYKDAFLMSGKAQEYIIKYEAKRFEEANEKAKYSILPETALKKDGVTAFIGHNDSTAIDICRRLQKAGIKIPQDASVTGFDRLEYMKNPLPFELTSILRDRKLMARTAFNMLYSKIASKAFKSNDINQMRLPVEFFTGNSSGKILKEELAPENV